jgi:hypothetical protein
MDSPNSSDIFSLSSSLISYSSAQDNVEVKIPLGSSSEESDEVSECDEQVLILVQMLSDIKYNPEKKNAKRNAQLQAIARGNR